MPQQSLSPKAAIGYSTMRKHLLLRLIRKQRGCAECGELRWEALEFHHQDPRSPKIAHGGQRNTRLASLTWKEMISEVEKCVILCANCHRVHTERKHNLDDLWEAITKNDHKVSLAGEAAFQHFGVPYPYPLTCKNGHPKGKAGPCKLCAAESLIRRAQEE